jgi:hypothetical protein|tara:strand:+ start:97 stop:897 length:801 start_codon:yes stop_codon:yes gene_type:complete
MMTTLHRFEMWAALVMIILLAGLSVIGAFWGTQRATEFFNSFPLSIFWLALTGLLLVGLVTTRSLKDRPGLLLIHLGCVFILVGAMWSSTAGHRVQKKLFGIDKVPFGIMIIYEGAAENRIVVEDGGVAAELPFRILLRDFRIEYYGDDSSGPAKMNGGKPGEIADDTGREPDSVSIIRDYFSDLMLFEEEKLVAQQVVEVNHPLHYGGYHFYQESYDHENEQYTILSVASDSGLNLVYTGYLMLSLGVVWLFWLRPILKRQNNGD